MTRLALIAFIVATPFAIAGVTQKPPCEPVKIAQMSFFAKSQESIRYIRVFEPINIFAAKAKKNVTMISKVSAERPVVKPKAKKVLKKKSKGVCGNKRKVWRTLRNGYRKFRCK